MCCTDMDGRHGYVCLERVLVHSSRARGEPTHVGPAVLELPTVLALPSKGPQDASGPLTLWSRHLSVCRVPSSLACAFPLRRFPRFCSSVCPLG